MILVDLSQIIMSSIIVDAHNEIKKNPQGAENFIKHMIFNMLLSFKKKFGKEYGEIVLCADSRVGYWRKDEFPWYKGHRKHDREKSNIDWQLVFKIISSIKEDLIEYFPYKLIEVDKAEADDVIAILTKYVQTNELVQEGLFDDEPQKVLVISSDGDLGQLQKYKNVFQWNNQHKKWVTIKDPSQYIIEHICLGDAGDNVPNILTSDQWAKARSETPDDKIRQSSFRKVRLDEFYEKGIDACQNESEKRNYLRNKKLVDLSEVPYSLEKKIVSSYVDYEKKGNKTKLMNYFIKNKMKLLFESLGDF